MSILLSPGSQFGHYRIESRLGAGGMGVVFAATDLRLGRTVALKVVSDHLAGDSSFRERFQREAATLARLDSPHIVSIFEHGEHEGSSFIATQLVTGGDLGDLLRQRGPLPPAAARSVAAQLAEALDDAHRSGVVHRDVKPANVLVRDPDASSMFVYLCDFGIAQAGDTGLTAPGSVAGSWAFLAPERLNGAPATPASDIYALGCVLWACLTGRTVYAGSDLQVAQAHLAAPVPQLPGHLPQSRQLNTILARCLAKDPAARFATAGQLHHALLSTDPEDPPARFGAVPPHQPPAGHLPGPARSPGGPSTARRKIALISTAVMVLLALSIGGVAWAMKSDDPDEGRDRADATTSPTPSDETEDPTDDPTEDPADPETSASGDPGGSDVTEILRGVAEESFPSDSTAEEPTARSWSVESDNIVDGTPRDLPDSQWDEATSWTVRHVATDRSYSVSVQHIPGDDELTFDWDCAAFDDTVSRCRQLTTSDGQPAYETWFHLPDSDAYSHRVAVPGDRAAGIAERSAGERVTGLPDDLSFAEAGTHVTLSTEELLRIAETEELLLPRPDPEPPLPSYSACVFDPTKPPDGCPEGLI